MERQYLNRVQLLGYVSGDVTIRQLLNGDAARFSIAILKQWTDKHTLEVRRTYTWVYIVVYGKLCGGVAQYLKKNDQVFVEGEINVRKNVDKTNDTTRSITEVVVRDYDGKLVLCDSGCTNTPDIATAATTATESSENFNQESDNNTATDSSDKKTSKGTKDIPF